MISAIVVIAFLVFWGSNARLAEMLKDAPVVYAQTYEDGTSIYGWRDCLKLHCTHSARLVEIEEIHHESK